MALDRACAYSPRKFGPASPYKGAGTLYVEIWMMGAFQPWHWILVILVVVVLFGGKGKLSGLMGDAAKGIKAFREGLKDDDKKNETPVEKVTDEVTKV